jgi:hypothetical protein
LVGGTSAAASRQRLDRAAAQPELVAGLAGGLNNQVQVRQGVIAKPRP